MLNIVMQEIETLKATLEAKNADYGGGDPMGNFKMSDLLDIAPFKGVLLRIGDKYGRVCSLAKQHTQTGKVLDESIDDTLRDLAGYALIAIAIRQLATED